jgi:folate-binding protein YgfZ
MRAALLDDRSVLRVSGDDARRFLEGIVTNDIEALAPDAARFAALLTPQGKIVADFFVAAVPDEDGGGFLLDAPRALADDIAGKLGFYKLRAKVAIEPRPELAVAAIRDGKAGAELGLVFDDPRHPSLGQRAVLPAAQARTDLEAIGATIEPPAAYHAMRIVLGVPEGGKDFTYGDAYPHEALMDQINGVDFRKGCFIGQEVVSRMERKTTPKTRIASVSFDAAPSDGIDVRAGERPAGHMGSSAEGRGLAMMRLDRVNEALGKGEPVTAGGIALTLQKPAWVRFAYPGEPGFGT